MIIFWFHNKLIFSALLQFKIFRNRNYLQIISNGLPFRCFYNIRTKLKCIANHRKSSYIIVDIQQLHFTSSLNRQLLDVNTLISHHIPNISLLFEFRSRATSHHESEYKADFFSIHNPFQTVIFPTNLPDRDTLHRDTQYTGTL